MAEKIRTLVRKLPKLMPLAVRAERSDELNPGQRAALLLEPGDIVKSLMVHEELFGVVLDVREDGFVKVRWKEENGRAITPRDESEPANGLEKALNHRFAPETVGGVELEEPPVEEPGPVPLEALPDDAPVVIIGLTSRSDKPRAKIDNPLPALSKEDFNSKFRPALLEGGGWPEPKIGWAAYKGLKKHERRGQPFINLCALASVPFVVEEMTKIGVRPCLSPELVDELRRMQDKAKAMEAEADERYAQAEDDAARQGDTIRPYQKEGIIYLRSRHGALLGDDTGLGKTMQALNGLPEGVPVLVVAPRSLIGIIDRRGRRLGGWLGASTRWRSDFDTSTTNSSRASEKKWRWPNAGEIRVTTWNRLPPVEDRTLEFSRKRKKIERELEEAQAERGLTVERIAVLELPYSGSDPQNNGRKARLIRRLGIDASVELRDARQELQDKLDTKRGISASKKKAMEARIQALEDQHESLAALEDMAMELSFFKKNIVPDALDKGFRELLDEHIQRRQGLDDAEEEMQAELVKLAEEERRAAEARRLILASCPQDLVVIYDEVHYAKNKTSQRARRALTVAEEARSRGGFSWGLTATPIMNKPEEMHHILKVLGIEDEVFGPNWRVKSLFGGVDETVGKANVTRVNYEGANVDPVVPKLIKRHVLIRKKREVLKDLPPLSFEDRYIELDENSTKALDALVEQIQKKLGVDITTASSETVMEVLGKSSVMFEEISRVRKILADAKAPAAAELLEELFIEQEGPLKGSVREPVLVFCHHIDPLETLLARYSYDPKKRPSGFKIVTGDASRTGYFVKGGFKKESRDRVIVDFQNGLFNGLVLSTTATSEGLNFQRASKAIQIDEEWNPAKNKQAYGRIERIGQENPMTIYRIRSTPPSRRARRRDPRSQAGVDRQVGRRSGGERGRGGHLHLRALRHRPGRPLWRPGSAPQGIARPRGEARGRRQARAAPRRCEAPGLPHRAEDRRRALGEGDALQARRCRRSGGLQRPPVAASL